MCRHRPPATWPHQLHAERNTDGSAPTALSGAVTLRLLLMCWPRRLLRDPRFRPSQRRSRPMRQQRALTSEPRHTGGNNESESGNGQAKTSEEQGHNSYATRPYTARPYTARPHTAQAHTIPPHTAVHAAQARCCHCRAMQRARQCWGCVTGLRGAVELEAACRLKHGLTASRLPRPLAMAD